MQRYHWWNQDFIVGRGQLKADPGGGARPIGGGGGGRAVRCQPIQAVGGGRVLSSVS